jgi:hypothetical protein
MPPYAHTPIVELKVAWKLPLANALYIFSLLTGCLLPPLPSPNMFLPFLL